MSAFGDGSVLFLVTAIGIGLVMMFIVKALSGKKMKMTSTSFVLTLLVPLIVGTGLMALGSFLEVHEAPELCGEYCHAMEPVYDSYNFPGNNSLMSGHADRGVTCLDCHTGPGWRGQIDVWLDVPNEAWQEVTGGYHPEELGGPVHNLHCTKCHDGGVAFTPGEVTTALGTLADPHDTDRNCGECHEAHEGGVGQTPDACAVCHGLHMEDFVAAQLKHGERTGGDCLDCHDRVHPEDAQIPFSEFPDLIKPEFCSDCHVSEYRVLNTTDSPLAHELYGDCTKCHKEHEPAHPIHDEESPFDDCAQCHVAIDRMGGIHNRTLITYLGVTNIDNDFCKACHASEVSSLNRNVLHDSLDCLSCHMDHELRVDFDDCTRCHGTDLPEWHVEDTIGCNWEYCHGDTWYH
jgi:nitrate/TMAO reductase-like tetraheme cytochrome c subunit